MAAAATTGRTPTVAVAVPCMPGAAPGPSLVAAGSTSFCAAPSLVDPKSYTYANPSQEQQQRVYQQFMQMAFFAQAAQQQRGAQSGQAAVPFSVLPGVCPVPVPAGFGGMLPFFPGINPYVQQSNPAVAAKLGAQGGQAAAAAQASLATATSQVPCGFLPCFPMAPFAAHAMVVPAGAAAAAAAAATAAANTAATTPAAAAATPVAATGPMLGVAPAAPAAGLGPMLAPGCIVQVPAAAVAASSSFLPVGGAAAPAPAPTAGTFPTSAAAAAPAAAAGQQQQQKAGQAAPAADAAARAAAAKPAAVAPAAAAAELELPELQSLLDDVQPCGSKEAQVGVLRASSPSHSGLSCGTAAGSNGNLASAGGGALQLGDFDLDLKDVLELDLDQLIGESLAELQQQHQQEEEGPAAAGSKPQQQQQLAKCGSLDSCATALLPSCTQGPAQEKTAATAAAAGAGEGKAKPATPTRPRTARARKTNKAMLAAAAAAAGLDARAPAPLKPQSAGVGKPPRKLTITLKAKPQQQQQAAAKAAASTGAAAPAAASEACGGSSAAPAAAVGTPDSGASSSSVELVAPLSPMAPAAAATGGEEGQDASIGSYPWADEAMDLDLGDLFSSATDRNDWDDLLMI